MIKYILITKVYPDWFREPLSPLERTWRLPSFFNEIKELIWKRLFFRLPNNFYKIKDGSIHIRTDWFRLLLQLGAPVAVVKIIIGLRITKKNWDENILPEYKKLLDDWSKEDLNNKDSNALWDFANEVMKQDVCYGARIAYVGIYSFATEWFVGKLYKSWVKGDKNEYHKLLIGFPNKTYEINKELFELSQIKKQDEKQVEFKFKEFIKNYGMKKFDVELVEPTFGERKEQIKQLIDLYTNNADINPENKLTELAKQREQQVEFVKENLKFKFITKPIFFWILKWAWEYVPLRETRRFYIGAGGYYIRKALNLIGERIGLKENMVFYLEKEEIEQLINNKLDYKTAGKITRERFQLREQQKTIEYG